MAGTTVFSKGKQKMNNPRIILEGHYMTYKTAIASLWNHSHDVTCISGDWNTRLGCSLWGDPIYPSRRVIKRAFKSIVTFMELFPDQTFIIDRFHISQQYYDTVFGTRYYNKGIEKRLAKMNSLIIYLRNHFDNYEEALECRLENKHGQRVNYPKSIDEYKSQERVLSKILHQTGLPYIEYDVTFKEVEEITKDLETIIKNF